MPQVKEWIVVDYIILEEEKSNTNQILLLKNGIFIKKWITFASIISQCISYKRDEEILWENKRKRFSDITLLMKIWTIFKVIG